MSVWCATGERLPLLDRPVLPAEKKRANFQAKPKPSRRIERLGKQHSRHREKGENRATHRCRQHKLLGPGWTTAARAGRSSPRSSQNQGVLSTARPSTRCLQHQCAKSDASHGGYGGHLNLEHPFAPGRHRATNRRQARLDEGHAEHYPAIASRVESR